MTIRTRDVAVAELKAKLSEALRDVEAGATVRVTRHGKVVAALVRADDLAILERLRAAGPSAGLASVAGGWKGARGLVDALSRE
jgi:prevent-host-death family protein